MYTVPIKTQCKLKSQESQKSNSLKMFVYSVLKSVQRVISYNWWQQTVPRGHCPVRKTVPSNTKFPTWKNALEIKTSLRDATGTKIPSPEYKSFKNLKTSIKSPRILFVLSAVCLLALGTFSLQSLSPSSGLSPNYQYQQGDKGSTPECNIQNLVRLGIWAAQLT